MAESGDQASATRTFVLPDLGEGLLDATVVSWMVAPGDIVELNQALCELETAKAVVEIPSPWAGTIVELGGDVGATLDVGSTLVQIAVSEPDSARQPTLVGYGPAPETTRHQRRRSGLGRPDNASTKPLAAPPVRKLALDLGVDLHTLAPGSGPDGIITRADVHAAAAPSPATVTPPRPPAPAAAPSALADPRHEPAVPSDSVHLPSALAGSDEGDIDRLVPVRGIRARIAENVTTSRTAIPDATCSVVVDCRRLLDLRARFTETLRQRGDDTVVTPFALVCRMLVEALRVNPELNATWVEDGPAIRSHGHLHLGIGTATERGLVVPVVRDAHRRSTRELAAEIARLAAGARAGTLAPSEMIGSTFTVSNFGALGLDEGIPVINHPEAGIVGVGAIKARPHVVDGEVVACPTATLTLAFDHRVADGAEAGRLLSTLRALLESPELLLIDR
jgi:pyruvate dehydrogenase E2 component (dihydrolipoamide acetyltransferase)